MTPLQVQHLREATPGCQSGIVHFNHAGASLPSQATLDAIIEQLHLTKLMPLWAKINDDMMRLDVQTIYPKRDPDKIIAEHKKLIDAFWNGRLDAALEISAEHRLQILKVYLAKHKDKK